MEFVAFRDFNVQYRGYIDLSEVDSAWIKFVTPTSPLSLELDSPIMTSKKFSIVNAPNAAYEFRIFFDYQDPVVEYLSIIYLRRTVNYYGARYFKVVRLVARPAPEHSIQRCKDTLPSRSAEVFYERVGFFSLRTSTERDERAFWDKRPEEIIMV